jgi:hypothetical protein
MPGRPQSQIIPGRKRSPKPLPLPQAPEPIGPQGNPRRTPTDAERDARVKQMSPPPGEAFDPAYEAHRLRMAGYSWDEAARRAGYGTAGHAAVAVTTYLQKAATLQSAQHLQDALQMQIDRYEAVLNAWWEAGVDGIPDPDHPEVRTRDEKAASVVLRTLERLDRIQRLTEGDVQITRETIVISADPDEYVRQLQAAAASSGR